MKKTLRQFLISLCLALVLVPAVAFGLDSRDFLMGLGMSAELANRIYSTLVGVDSSGNLVLPVASTKKLSVTVAGTEKASVSSAGLLTTADAINATGLQYPATSFETVAGAGTTVSDAAALAASAHVHRITGANGTVGWKFSSSLPVGSIEILLNTTAGVAKIYGESGSTVNGGSVDAAFTALTGIKPIVCFKTAALTYFCA
jgi:hypothetical protein